MSNRLGGKQGTAYTGTNANQPPNWTFNDRPPTQYDTQNVSVGDLWLDSSATEIERVWILVSLAGDAMSKGSLAEWVQLGSGSLESLTGNTGGAVFPDANSNINVVGDASSITIAGNPGTNTLTASTGPDVATSYITNPATGTAVPAAGVLTFAGAGGITASAAGSTVTFTASGVTATQCAFGAYKSVDSNNVTGDGTFYQVICDGELYDLSNNYDNTTGIFTAPDDGTYHFDTYIACHNIADQNLSGLNIETTNVVFHSDLQSPVINKSIDNILHFQLSVDINMNAGDTALIKISLGGGSGAKVVGVTGAIPPGSPVATYFCGHRLDPAASFITGTETFVTDAGTATPNLSGVVNVLAQNAALGCGSSVVISAPGSSNTIQLDVTDSDNNTIIGKDSGTLTLTSTNCTVLGNDCGSALTSGSSNIFIGNEAGNAITSGTGNTIIGDASVLTQLHGSTTLDGFYALGASVGANGTPATPFLHNWGGNHSGNTFLGYNAGSSFSAGQQGANVDNTGLGQSSLESLTTGINNVCVGYQAGSDVTTGNRNVLIGRDAGFDFSTGSDNVCVGNGAGNNLTGAESRNLLLNDPGVTGLDGFIAITVPDTAIPSAVGFNMHNYPGDNAANGSNIFIGRAAGNRTMTGGLAGVFAAIGIGDGALNALTTGPHNIAMGGVSGLYITTGNGNVLLGHGTGSNIGAGTGITTGSYNIAIGYTAGTDWTGGDSNNIAIGYGTCVNGDSNTIRIGAKAGVGTPQTKCFIEGIRGRTTGNADAVAVLVDSAGQLGTVSSSMRYKSNIEPMGCVSDRLMKLEPVTFSWKSDSTYRQQLGLIAEEVEAVFPELVVHDKEGLPETVKYHDLPVLLLNELKKLAARVKELETRLNER